MRRSLVALLVLLAAVTLASAPHAARSAGPQYVAPAGSGALFLVSGHGWGHGVGMGQWGAQGYALQGYTDDQILAAYYPGTTAGQTSVSSIRVLLANGQRTLTISSTKSITVEDADGVDHTLPAGKTVLTPALELAVDGGAKQALAPPLTFSPASGTTLTVGRPYRGQVLVDVVSGKLRAINVVPLEQYLYGVVASEMPSSWLPAALEAQAVAARSYALASRRAAAPFD
ncbi:MAG TPA: SpoIID/LytB domain-containing protein, partial [Gaiellaceae bacterium]|nr:SpoIID/LytB domain-containing protein [Gaiellaceae bacterium]